MSVKYVCNFTKVVFFVGNKVLLLQFMLYFTTIDGAPIGFVLKLKYQQNGLERKFTYYGILGQKL